MENKDLIESDWDIKFGDRKIEIVFIGQNINEAQMRSQLDACLATEQELQSEQWQEGYQDNWPVERAYALE